MGDKALVKHPGTPVEILVDEQSFTFETGYVFRGMTISPAVDGWNCVIRATDKKGVKVYAIQSAPTAEEACDAVMGVIQSKEAHYFWRMDSFATD